MMALFGPKHVGISSVILQLSKLQVCGLFWFSVVS